MTTDRDDTPNWRPGDALLHRFVDGDLRGADRTAVEALLAGDHEALADVRHFQDQNIGLQALFPRRMEDRMLPAAALNLARSLRRRRLVRRALAASIAGLALLGAGTAGWNAQRYVSEQLRAPVVAVFPQSTAPTAPGDASVPTTTLPPVPAATDPPPANAPAWLGENARRVPVHPPNLQPVGFQLVDGRADLTAYGPVIRFAYTPSEGGEAPRLALTVASFGSDRRSLATTINPQHASLFWQTGPLLYALSGDVAPGQLLRVADAVAKAEPKPSKPAAAAATEAKSDAETPSLPVAPNSDPGEASKEL